MNHQQNQFGGDKKVGRSLLSRPENYLKNWAVPKIPESIETYHLTMMTLVWSLINICLGFLARMHLKFLWLVSLMILFQYLTDLFDGELGRQRNTGLIKWGFYMDHLLDYIFLCSLVFVGYMISPPRTGDMVRCPAGGAGRLHGQFVSVFCRHERVPNLLLRDRPHRDAAGVHPDKHLRDLFRY